MKKLISISTLVATVLLTGCNQIPTYEQPTTELPDSWDKLQPSQVLTLEEDEHNWWQQLSGDQALAGLINEALIHNSDIALAKLNLLQAQSQLRQSELSEYPDLSATGGISRSQNSGETYPSIPQATYNHFSLGALLSYELDLWGRADALTQQAEANYKASLADQKTVKFTITASVAQAYLNLMALNQNIKLAESAVQSRKEALQLRQSQLEYGRVTPLNVHQAEAELASVEIALHQQEAQRNIQLHALAALVGRSPKQLTEISTQAIETQALTQINSLPVPKALPSDLLTRRPDILAAEQRLIAANANIGVAKAALFPSISLTGLLGFQSESLGNLFDGNALNWNSSVNIKAPIFGYELRHTQVTISKAQKEAMIIHYQQTIRNAFKEVLDALTQLEGSAKQLQAQQRQVAALNQTLALSQKRYKAGYSSYLEVLDAQRSLFNAELSQVSMRLQHSSALVKLYKALGGNWKEAKLEL